MSLVVTPLTLGTVQLGMNYGIANTDGKPADDVGTQVLATAAANGITTWDTSRTYGDSESVIGKFLLGRPDVPITLVSKFRLSRLALDDRSLARAEAFASVKASLQALQCKSLHLLLYHHGPDEPLDRVMERLPGIFTDLRDAGLIHHGGVSLYYPDQVDLVLDRAGIHAVQLPVNIFDQRALHNGALEALQASAIQVFARSVFLQGLFFLESKQIPDSLSEARPFIAKLEEIAHAAQRDRAELAFVYVRDLVGVSSIVFGAERREQVIDNLAWQDAPPLDDGLRQELHTVFQGIPYRVLTPGQW